MDSNNTEQTDQPETHPLGVLGHFNKYKNVYGGVSMIVASVVGLFSLWGMIAVSGKNWPDDQLPKQIQNPPPSKRISVIAQAKPPGVDFWSRTLGIFPRRGRIRGKLRVENTGALPLTGLVAGAELGEPITPVPGKCWQHSKQCRGSLFGSGVPLPDLQPGQWTTVVFSANVPEEILGGAYPVRLKVSSDQTGEETDSAEIVVSASTAEKEVWPFLKAVEEGMAVSGSPEIAKKSMRLLLGQRMLLTLEHPHRFGQIKQVRERIEGGPIDVADLYYEHWLQGKVVELRGRVLERPTNEDDDEDVVKQKVELGVPGVETRLRCYIPRKREALFSKGDELEVKAVVVAWAPEDSVDAGLTVAACPAARVVRSVPRLDRAQRR